ncbi:sister chromatid cohesion protein Dcc1 [Trametes gibbosa]|nr:sister chromatid cohesion protein Dcc1 [Trametes gibbosa]
MAEFDLRFASTSRSDAGSFKLLELPPDLCNLIERVPEGTAPPRFTIKGASDEDAVFCTAEKTYTVRSVVLSNSVCVVTRDPGDVDADLISESLEEVVIRDQLSEIIELVPSVPRLHRLTGLLRGREYDDCHEDEELMSDDDEGCISVRTSLTYGDALGTIQASDTELDRGLRDRRVLILRGELRPIAPSYLTTILEALLNTLVSYSLPHTDAPLTPLLVALEEEHEVRRDVTRQILGWFGRVDEGELGSTWEMDVAAVVREVGLGILRAYKDDPITETAFLEQWRKTVGDTFEDRVSLALLSGNFLTSTDTLADPSVILLTYYPCSALPVDPGARFAELFLARPRWKTEQITPFLTDIAVDSKERDKLLLKHARAITDPGGIWYTARARYNA